MTEPTPYERASEGRCYKLIRESLELPDPSFVPVELSREEFLDLAQVMDVTGS